jgi:hypothetical protein
MLPVAECDIHSFGFTREVSAQRVPIDFAHVSDWMFVDGGKLVGGFTTRLLRMRMSPEESERERRLMPKCLFVLNDSMKKPNSRHSATRRLGSILFSNDAHRVAHL